MRILVVEDQAFFNAYLMAVCQRSFPGDDVVGVGTIAGARCELQASRCALMLLDILLPDGDGFDFSEEAISLNPILKIVGLSVDCTEYSVHRLCKSPIHVFVDKNAHSAEILQQAFRSAMSGTSFYSPSVEIVRRRLNSANVSFTNRLTCKEIDVLSLVGMGLSNADIAQKLGVASATVGWHCKELMRRLELKNRADLVVFANKKGFSHLHPFFNDVI